MYHCLVLKFVVGVLLILYRSIIYKHLTSTRGLVSRQFAATRPTLNKLTLKAPPPLNVKLSAVNSQGLS